MEGEPQPKKQRKPAKSTKSSKPTLSPDQLKSLLKEALKGYAEDKYRSTSDDLGAMMGTLEEFLKTFVLIGYTLDGEPFSVINANSQQEADSLSTAVTRFFYTRCQGGGIE